MTVRSRPLLLGLLATLLVVIAIASLFYRPDSIKQYLIQQVELQLGRKIEVGEARLRLFPRVRLTLSDVIIRDLDPSWNFFSAKQVDLVIRSTPLWQFKVVVKRLTLDQPRMELRRDAAGHWNFLNTAESGGGGGGEAGGSGGTGEGGNPLGLLLLIQQTTLTGGELSVVDEFRPDGSRSFRMTMLDAAIATGLKDILADVRLAATIPAEHGVTSLSLNGKLTRPEPPAQPLIGEPGHPPAVQFQGRAEALNVDIRRAADFFAPRPIPERLHGATNLRGTISITPGVGGYDLVLSDMTAGMGQLSLRGQASLSGIMTAQPTFSLTFSSAPVGLDELLDWFPIHWVNPQLAAIVEDREVGGLIEVVSATLTGTVKPELRASLTGELRLQRGHALVGSGRTQVENLSGTVIVESDRIKVTNVAGRYGPLRMNGGKGTVSFLTPGPWLDLEVTGEMAASDLAVTLGNAVTSASLSKSFRDLRKVQGNSVVTFRMAGPLNDFGALKFLGGEVLAQDLGFHSPLAPEPILGVNGRITFAPKSVVFDGISGRLGEGRFELQGTIDTEAAAVFKGFTVRASANVAQVMKWFPTAALSKTVLHGAVGATVSLSGPMDTPLIKAEVELKDAALNFSHTMQKAVGTPASLKFEATLPRSRLIAFDRFELHLPPIQITGRGTVRLGPKFAVDASLASNQVSLASLPKGMSLGSVEAGTLEVSLDVKGKGTDWKVWQITGWVALTDGRVTAQDLEGPLSGVYVRLHLIRNGAEIKRLAFKIKDSDVSLSGSIRNWDKTPIISVKGTSSQLDIDLLI
ncbi:MAG: AsmA family protein, partial [Nitrospirae bacterium]